MNRLNEKGIGLVEVIVALLLLSIGVLGFSILQIRAMDASLDASKRIQAMNLARDLAERMRANKEGLSKSILIKNKENEKLIDAYSSALSKEFNPNSYKASCENTSVCDSEGFAQEDVNQVLFRAYTLGMTVALNNCPGDESNRSCVFVAWGETEPFDGSNQTSCTQNGSFLSDSECIVLEAY